MVHRPWLLVLLQLVCASTSSQAQQALPVTEIAPGVYVHQGAIALMTRENDGAIANVGFVVGQTQRFCVGQTCGATPLFNSHANPKAESRK